MKGSRSTSGLAGSLANDRTRCLIALLVPFAYFFASRVPSLKSKVGWALNYLLPVLGLSIAADGGWSGAVSAAFALVAVYSAYEFGYLVNDTVVVEHESAPTLRLSSAVRRWMRERLGLALCVRAAIGGVCLWALSASTETTYLWIVVTGWTLLWPCFALYNHWRGRITIALHLVLVSLRFCLPIAAATGPESIAPHWACLLLLYPFPNTYEAAWKPRYGLPRLRRMFGDEDRFRVSWYAAVTALALAWVAWSPAPPQQVFLASAVYFLAKRTLALHLRRWALD